MTDDRNLEQVRADIDAIDLTGNLLLLDQAASGFRPGWTMQFPEDFKTTNEAFVLSGLSPVLTTTRPSRSPS